MPRTLITPIKHVPSAIYWLFVLLAYIPATTANDVIPLFKANYQADIKGFRVNASRELLKQGNNEYKLLFNANSMIATLEESTTVRWADNRFIPLNYSYLRNVIGKKEKRRVYFDHQGKSIESHYRGAQQTIPYSAQLLDALSYQLQLQQDLRDGKSPLHYNIVTRGKTKLNAFTREKEEVLNTKLGQLRTIKVSVEHDSNKRQTHIWFAADWEYLLVRFEQYEKGKKEFVINLTDATIDRKPIKGLANAE